MKEKRYQEVVYSIDTYTNISKEEAKQKLWSTVAQQIKMLLEAEYVCVVRRDEYNNVIIDYEHDEELDFWGCANPEWITEDEKMLIESNSTYYNNVDDYDEEIGYSGEFNHD